MLDYTTLLASTLKPPNPISWSARRLSVSHRKWSSYDAIA